ncbi:hypothetical protein [Streptomyces cyaneofuscatus]|uniref:hypothetical protein n=1 Tax=Streptomyces cyaneofuscatus TaxID=66883 RepID=UPI003418F1F2
MPGKSEFEELPELTVYGKAAGTADAEASKSAVALPRTGSNGSDQNEMAGLVLLINTVLGGLGTLYLTTKSPELTIGGAVLVLLLTIVVLVVRRVAASADE